MKRPSAFYYYHVLVIVDHCHYSDTTPFRMNHSSVQSFYPVLAISMYHSVQEQKWNVSPARTIYRLPNTTLLHTHPHTHTHPSVGSMFLTFLIQDLKDLIKFLTEVCHLKLEFCYADRQQHVERSNPGRPTSSGM